MKKTINYTDGERIKIIEDFLPIPEEIVLEDDA